MLPTRHERTEVANLHIVVIGLIINPPWMGMGHSESGTSHLSLTWWREQIEFTQKVMCDSGSQCRGDRNGLWSVQKSPLRRSFLKRIHVSRSFHPSQEETFNCLVEWWVPPCDSQHIDWASNRRENNALSFYSISCFTQMRPSLIFYFFSFLKGLGWAMKIRTKPSHHSTTEGKRGWMSPWNLSAWLVQTYEDQLVIPQSDRRQQPQHPELKKKKKQNWWLVVDAVA